MVGRMMNAITNLYEVRINKVRNGYKNEKWFEMRAGVEQWSVLSPLLFISYLNKVIKNFKAEWNILV